MESFKHKEVKISVYRDPMHWAIQFYDIPTIDKDKVIITEQPPCAGMACPSDNSISIFIDKNCKYSELLSVVAHELGHITEANHLINPPDNDESFDLHEAKAEYYEQFVMDAYSIANKIFNK